MEGKNDTTNKLDSMIKDDRYYRENVKIAEMRRGCHSGETSISFIVLRRYFAIINSLIYFNHS